MFISFFSPWALVISRALIMGTYHITGTYIFPTRLTGLGSSSPLFLTHRLLCRWLQTIDDTNPVLHNSLRRTPSSFSPSSTSLGQCLLCMWLRMLPTPLALAKDHTFRDDSQYPCILHQLTTCTFLLISCSVLTNLQYDLTPAQLTQFVIRCRLRLRLLD